jgi:hypothetical protein
MDLGQSALNLRLPSRIGVDICRLIEAVNQDSSQFGTIGLGQL